MSLPEPIADKIKSNEYGESNKNSIHG